MNLLDENLSKQSEFETHIKEYNFIMIKCKKCVKKELFKKRDCDLLYGYKKPCCKQMDIYTENKTKETNKKILGKAFYDLLNKVKPI